MRTFVLNASRFCRRPALGMLLIRIAAGIVFFAHGYSKIGNIPGVEGMMIHFGLPGGVGLFIAWLEVIGGIALVLGIIPRVFGVAFGIEMLVAIFLTGGAARGYQPHELEIVLVLLSFGIALAGGGRYSVFAMECRTCGGMLCDECGNDSHGVGAQELAPAL